MASCHQTGRISLVFANFLALFDLMCADDWRIYRAVTQFGFNADQYAIGVARDDVTALQDDSSFNPACVLLEGVLD
jgi:hypothetical protein